MACVFLNYRRADSGRWANELYGHLRERFGADLVFEDVASIEPGENWMEALQDEVRGCEVFLALIGPSWLHQKNAEGRRRIDDENDVLRIELNVALAETCTVIPILVGGAIMPGREVLPAAIAGLLDRQALSLSDDRWNADVKTLIDKLRDLISPTRQKVPLTDIQQEAYKLQLRYFELLEKEDDAAGALQCARTLSKLLDRHLPLFPHDRYLKTCRGFSLKNEAMALQSLGRRSEFGILLGDAERIFRAMRAEDPKDPDTLLGSGNIEALRGNFDVALEYINRCLQLSPDHASALHDKGLVEAALKRA